MEFIFADSIDMVDPKYSFLTDQKAEDFEPYWDEHFTSETLGHAPFDGVLLSRALLGGGGDSRLTKSLGYRLRRVGAREFLRLNQSETMNKKIFGDCGSFTYHREEVPPYTVEDTLELYDELGVTHGFSVDHIIFDFILKFVT